MPSPFIRVQPFPALCGLLHLFGHKQRCQEYEYIRLKQTIEDVKIKTYRDRYDQRYEKLQQLLDKTNKTAYQVSKDTGISTATLSSWKNGEYRPKVDKLKILADYFGVSIEHFLE